MWTIQVQGGRVLICSELEELIRLKSPHPSHKTMKDVNCIPYGHFSSTITLWEQLGLNPDTKVGLCCYLSFSSSHFIVLPQIKLDGNQELKGGAYIIPFTIHS